jgi:hypothetical protein
MIKLTGDEWTISRWRQAPLSLDERLAFGDDETNPRVPLWVDILTATAVMALLWTSALVLLL